MKPFKTYNGGKNGNGTYQQIINHIPPHNIFISAFAGNCGVFNNISRSGISILNDKDPRVTERWKSFPPPGCIISESLPDLTRKYRDTTILPAVIVNNGDAAGIIAKYGDTAGAFIYCDPPYMISKRSCKNKPYYLFDWKEDQQHIDFLAIAVTVKSNVMISAYENDLYNNILKDWNRHTFMSMTRKGLREEIIYYNYPRPSILHDFRYLGKDFRERERIKLKVKRWRNKLANLNEIERTAILSDLISNNKITSLTLANM